MLSDGHQLDPHYIPCASLVVSHRQTVILR